MLKWGGDNKRDFGHFFGKFGKMTPPPLLIDPGEYLHIENFEFFEQFLIPSNPSNPLKKAKNEVLSLGWFIRIV